MQHFHFQVSLLSYLLIFHTVYYKLNQPKFPPYSMLCDIVIIDIENVLVNLFTPYPAEHRFQFLSPFCFTLFVLTTAPLWIASTRDSNVNLSISPFLSVPPIISISMLSDICQWYGLLVLEPRVSLIYLIQKLFDEWVIDCRAILMVWWDGSCSI